MCRFLSHYLLLVVIFPDLDFQFVLSCLFLVDCSPVDLDCSLDVRNFFISLPKVVEHVGFGEELFGRLNGLLRENKSRTHVHVLWNAVTCELLVFNFLWSLLSAFH